MSLRRVSYLLNCKLRRPSAALLSDVDVLELVDAVHALGLFSGVYEAAERRLELLTTRAMGHAAQTWAIPIDLACFRVECALLICLFLESFYATLAIL